jgi:effector-binding domain-containing protein
MKTKISFKLLITCAFYIFCPLIAWSQVNSSLPPIEVKTVDPIKAVTIKVSVPSSEISKKIGELYGKLYSYLDKYQIVPSGAPFAVYYEFDPNGKTTFEACVPVKTTIKSDGDIIFKVYGQMKACTALYTGSYEKIGPIYEAIMKHMKDKALSSTGVSWEVYLTDPAKISNPEDNKTLIYFPIK